MQTGATNGPGHEAVTEGHAGACLGLEMFMNFNFANDVALLAEILKTLVLLLGDPGPRSMPDWNGDQLR